MHCIHVLQFAEVWQRSLKSCNSSALRFVNFYSHPPSPFVSLIIAPHLTSKLNENKTTIYLPLFCLMETMQIFFGKWWFTSFKALLQTRHRANRLQTTVCSEVLFRPLCFDYGVYSYLIINSRMDKTMHLIFFNNMSLTNSCLPMWTFHAPQFKTPGFSASTLLCCVRQTEYARCKITVSKFAIFGKQ